MLLPGFLFGERPIAAKRWLFSFLTHEQHDHEYQARLYSVHCIRKAAVVWCLETGVHVGVLAIID